MVHETSCQEMAPSLNTMTPQSLLLPNVVTGRCFFQWAFATAREYPSCIWKKRMEKKLSKKERNHARNQKSGSRGKKTSWTSSSVNFPLLSLSPIGFAQSPPITTNYTGRKTCKNGCIPRSFVTCFKCDDFICRSFKYDYFIYRTIFSNVAFTFLTVLPNPVTFSTWYLYVIHVYNIYMGQKEISTDSCPYVHGFITVSLRRVLLNEPLINQLS